MFGRAAGGIFFSGSKAQRSELPSSGIETFRKKMMPAASPWNRTPASSPCVLYGTADRAVTNPCERGQAVSQGCIPKAMIQEDVLKLSFLAM